VDQPSKIAGPPLVQQIFTDRSRLLGFPHSPQGAQRRLSRFSPTPSPTAAFKVCHGEEPWRGWGWFWSWGGWVPEKLTAGCATAAFRLRLIMLWRIFRIQKQQRPHCAVFAGGSEFFGLGGRGTNHGANFNPVPWPNQAYYDALLDFTEHDSQTTLAFYPWQVTEQTVLYGRVRGRRDLENSRDRSCFALQAHPAQCPDSHIPTDFRHRSTNGGVRVGGLQPSAFQLGSNEPAKRTRSRELRNLNSGQFRCCDNQGRTAARSHGKGDRDALGGRPQLHRPLMQEPDT